MVEKMKKVKKVSDYYPRLYHYTTWKSLLEILESQKLWATHYKFLNDYTELVLFKNKLISILYPIVLEQYKRLAKKDSWLEQRIQSEGGIKYNAEHDTKVFVNSQYRGIYNVTGDEIYISSFCGEHEEKFINDNGLLSQWRAYGTDGGCALVFNTKKLEELCHLECSNYLYKHMDILSVIYSDDEKTFREEMSEDLKILAEDTIKMFSPDSCQNEDVETFLQGYNSFLRCITRFKHKGFKEENEVRIVAIPYQDLSNNKEKEWGTKDQKERLFRDRDGLCIPYIELFDSNISTLPIEKIIIGPHKDKELRAKTLEIKLRKTKIEIVCSDIPYVGSK